MSASKWAALGIVLGLAVLSGLYWGDTRQGGSAPDQSTAHPPERTAPPTPLAPEVITVETATPVPRDPVLEYDSCVIGLIVGNRGSRPAELIEATTNCRCATLHELGGAPLSLPVAIAPSEKRRIDLRVAPAGLYGKVRYSVTATCRVADASTVTKTLDVEFQVHAGLRAFPARVAYANALEPGVEATSLINLFDSYPGDGIGIERIDSSDPARLLVEKISRFDPIQIPPTSGSGVNARADFRHRHQLRIRYTPAPTHDSWIREVVTITPSREGMPPVQVAITGRTSPPECDVSPKALSIYLSEGALAFRRELHCRLRNINASDLRVTHAPKFAKVSLELADSGKAVIVVDGEISANAGESMEDSISLGINERDSPVVIIPVKVRVRSPPASRRP